MQVARFINQVRAFSPDLKVYALTMDQGRSRRMPIISVGHHMDAFETPPEVIDQNVAVELFVDPWPTGNWWENQPVQGEAVTVQQIIDELGSKHQESDLRVAVPTDEGHHRVLAIEAMGFAGDRAVDEPLTLDLSVGAWDDMHRIIRTNLRMAGG